MSRILTIIGILGAIFVLWGVWYLNQSDEGASGVDTDNTELIQEEARKEEVGGSGDIDGDVKEFVVRGTHFAFDVEEIRVSEGDTVRIVFESVDMPHDWVLDEFNAKTDILNPGEVQTIEFIASEAGEYEYYCSVGNHRAMGMVGTLIVE